MKTGSVEGRPAFEMTFRFNIGFLGVKKQCVDFRSVTKDMIPPWAC